MTAQRKLYTFTTAPTMREAIRLNDELEASGIPVWLEPYPDAVLLLTTAPHYADATARSQQP